jgi:hypothetical protein
MTKELGNQDDPLDANLEEALPGLNQWQRVNNMELQKVKEAVQQVQSGFQNVNNQFDELHDVLKSNREDSDRHLAATFVNIAQKLLERGGSTVNGLRQDNVIAEELRQVVTGTSSRTAQAAQPIESPGDAEELTDTLFQMVPKHLSLLDLVHEWYGSADYYDEYGGIKGRNERFKTQWRKKCSINAMHYSRTERTVRAVNEYATMHGINTYDAAERLDEVYKVECKESVTNFVKWAQHEGLLAKKKSRGTSQQARRTTVIYINLCSRSKFF